jgi:aldehyde:ferredoxin oxidoreductase
MDIIKMKENHKVLTEYEYELGEIDKGYTNRTLYVNISDNTITSKPVTEMMKEKFVGGKGLACGICGMQQLLKLSGMTRKMK